jgi:two-component system sensor histidine kinase RegB
MIESKGLLGSSRFRLLEWRNSLADFFHSDQGSIRVHTVTVTRWIAVVGQLFTILLVHFSLDIELPIIELLAAVCLSALINLILVLCLKATARLSERSATLLLAFDIIQLIYLLALTGGVQNPFAILMVFPVALAASTLGRRWTIALTILAVVGVTVLALLPLELPWRDGRLHLPALYLWAGWSALSVTTALVAGFTWSIAEEARRRSTALAAIQLALAREQEMSALGGQAAAAAHLLGTPLATINIIAKELVRELPEGSPFAEDAQVLLDQAQRCREIMKAIGQRRDTADHDRFIRAPLSSLLDAIAQEYGRPGIQVKVRLDRHDGTDEPEVAPTPELRHSLANLVDNAIQFAAHQVDITVRPSTRNLVLVIEDDGPGFPPEVLDWLGEPYLSTRHDKGGLGLGVFIAITLLARSNAKLHFDNKMKGARVTVTWPSNALERANEEVPHERRRR